MKSTNGIKPLRLAFAWLILSLVSCQVDEVHSLSAEPARPAADWPQFRGPNRDGVSQEKGLLKSWPAGGPQLLWTYTEAGLGYSGPAIVGNHIYLAGARGASEYVFALDAGSAKEVWSTKIGPKFTWKGNNWNAGPSATPTVDGDLVYALGGQGILVCVDAANKGTEIWRKDLPKEMSAEVNPILGAPKNLLGWGFAWSPLVDGNQLICLPGGKEGTVAALDKKNGTVLWRSKEFTDQAPYASPIVAEIGGIRQYIVLTNEHLAGVSAKDGKLLWQEPRKYTDIVACAPIFHNNCVYTTTGSEGCDLVQLTVTGQEIKATSLYSTKDLCSMTGGVVLVGDHIYGSDDQGWSCQEFKSGTIVWSQKRKLGKGSLTCADGNLYCYSERDGITALIEATPTGWKENGRLKLPTQSKIRLSSGKFWTHPVVANGRLYLRDQDLLFCYDIKDKK